MSGGHGYAKQQKKSFLAIKFPLLEVIQMQRKGLKNW